MDHLFVDQAGVPTIVEVKRSSDARIRREVVGQMLDYAANAVVYWNLDHLRAMFESGPKWTAGKGDKFRVAESKSRDLQQFLVRLRGVEPPRTLRSTRPSTSGLGAVSVPFSALR